MYIIETIESHSSFKIPRFNNLTPNTTTGVLSKESKTTHSSLPVDYDPNDNELPTDVQNTGSLLALLGVVLIGIVGAVSVIVVADYFAHETVQNIPVINTISDIVLVIWNTAYDSLTNYFNNGPRPDTGRIKPESISISSSGGSDITVTDNRTQTITPPTSRSSTPYPDVNNDWA